MNILNSQEMRVIDVCIVKKPGPKDQALVCPWKGLFYLKPYKLKVSKVIYSA